MLDYYEDMTRNPKVSASGTDLASEELKILVDNIEEYAFFKIDTKGKILSWNVGVKRILGYNKKEFINKNFSIIFSKSDLKQKYDKKELNSVKRTGKAADERWHVRKDGTLFRASGITTKLYDREGDLKGYVKIMRDITEELEFSQKIKESEDRYKGFINNTTEGIWRFDLEKPLPNNVSIDKQIDHIYKYAYLAECNDATAKMYGFKQAEDIIGTRIGEFLIRDDPANIEYLKNFINSNFRLVNAESIEVDKDGVEKHFTNSLIGIKENGQIIGAWGSQRDITMQYEIIKQKDEFVGVVSHELKTPLTSIKAYIQLLQKKYAASTDNDAITYLAKVNNQLNKLSTLINELLDVTRMESGKFKLDTHKFVLDELLDEVISDMQSISEKHKIIKKNDFKGKITSDRERLGQILINLISNAIKYSPNSNKVIVKVEVQMKNLKICVRDFGIGISKTDQKKLFKRFFRAGGDKTNTFPGLGLGLYISQELAKRLGGFLSVSSIKGKGSTFCFTLPK